MTKTDLLDYLNRTGSIEAAEVAAAFGENYSSTAMALLRLCRQGLANRFLEPGSRGYGYELTDRGADRLAYLQDLMS